MSIKVITHAILECFAYQNSYAKIKSQNFIINNLLPVKDSQLRALWMTSRKHSEKSACNVAGSTFFVSASLTQLSCFCKVNFIFLTALCVRNMSVEHSLEYIRFVVLEKFKAESQQKTTLMVLLDSLVFQKSVVNLKAWYFDIESSF